MAEIKIEKKKPIWPWIILVLVILALLYFLVFANDDDENEIEEDTTEQVEQETTWEDTDTTSWETETDTMSGQGVQAYVAHVSDKSKMGIDHEYTNRALLSLVSAVEAKANELNYDISADMQSVKQDAQKIESDPMATTHANTIKDAGTKIANILEKMQKEKFPNLSKEVEEVKTAAQNIQGSTQTLNQKDQINKFFDEAADALQKMS